MNEPLLFKSSGPKKREIASFEKIWESSSSCSGLIMANEKEEVRIYGILHEKGQVIFVSLVKRKEVYRIVPDCKINKCRRRRDI